MLLGLIIAVYLISLIIVRYFFKIVYSTRGRWRMLTPYFIDYIITFFPIINTLSAIILMCEQPYGNKKGYFYQIIIRKILR